MPKLPITYYHDALPEHLQKPFERLSVFVEQASGRMQTEEGDLPDNYVHAVEVLYLLTRWADTIKSGRL
jgi:hypothetical protein